MGQRFASLQVLLKMDGKKHHTEQVSSGYDQNESNGNNVAVLSIKEIKSDNNESLDLDNHNSRFESLYSQPSDNQDSKQRSFSNGNLVESTSKQEFSLCDPGNGNNSCSLQDSNVNPALKRSLKTLSFVKRKGDSLYY